MYYKIRNTVNAFLNFNATPPCVRHVNVYMYVYLFKAVRLNVVFVILLIGFNGGPEKGRLGVLKGEANA